VGEQAWWNNRGEEYQGGLESDASGEGQELGVSVSTAGVLLNRK
jgi:hypothetical protein